MQLFSEMRPLVKVPLKYGVVGSGLAILLLLVLYFSNRHPLLIPIIYDYRLLLFGLFTYFAISEFKAYHNNGILNFWQGMFIGFIVCFTVATLVGLFIIIYSHFDVDFFRDYITGTLKGMEIEKEALTGEGKITITEERFNEQLVLLRQLKPPMLAIDYIIKSCIIGFPLTIILSVFLRKTEDRFK